jgi:hypothetical protein
MAKRKEQASQENPNQEVLNILDMGMGPGPTSDEDPYDDGPDEPIVLDLPSKPKRLPDNNDAPVDRSTQRDLREIKQKTPGSNASFKIYRKEFGNNINCGTFSRSELGNLRIDEFIQEHIAPVSPGPKNSRIWEYTYEIWANNRVVERGPVIRIDPNSVNDMVGDPVRELNNYPPSENARMDAATQLAATIMESQKFQAQQAIERERIAREDSKNNMDLFLKMMEMRQQNQGGGGDMMVMLPLLMKMMEPKVDLRPAQDPTLAIFAEK